MKRAKKLKHKNAKSSVTTPVVSRYAEKIKSYYGIDVQNDVTTTHPQIMCQTCYKQMNNYSRNPESPMHYIAKENAKKMNSMWTSFHYSVSISSCHALKHLTSKNLEVNL